MHAIILFAHGSRDPLWHKPIQAVAQRIAERDTEVLVRCAYLELTEPDLLHVANELAKLNEAGLRGIALSMVNYADDLPFFAQEVLPRLEKKGIRAPVKG